MGLGVGFASLVSGCGFWGCFGYLGFREQMLGFRATSLLWIYQSYL